MRYLFLILLMISCKGQNTILPNEINNSSKDLKQIKNTRFFISNNKYFNQNNTTFHYKKDSLSGVYFNESVGNFYRISNYIRDTNNKNSIESFPIKINGLKGFYYLENNDEHNLISIHFGNDTIINSIKAIYNQESKSQIINLITSSSYDLQYKIDYNKIFTFKIDNSNTLFKEIEYNPNVLIYSKEKLVTSENPFFIDKIYISEFYNKDIETVMNDYLNNLNEDIYQLDLNKEVEMKIDNLATLNINLIGKATLNSLNGLSTSNKVSINFYFVQKDKKLYVIRTEIFDNNSDSIKEINKILQSIKFQ